MSGAPTDAEILCALADLAANTRSHYQRAYRDYSAGDHRPAKKALYDLVMRKVNDVRRRAVNAANAPRGDASPGTTTTIVVHAAPAPPITAANAPPPLLATVGLVTVVAFAFGAGMAAFQSAQSGC